MPAPPTRTRARLPVCLALLAAAVLPAGPAAADEPGWTAEPAAGAARPAAARPAFYLQGAPGTVLEDRLALVNTGDLERTVTLRGADAPAGTAPAGAASWFSFGAGSTVRIPPRTRAVVPFTVTVPPASPPGDHSAAVIASGPGHEASVRVHLRVDGPALAALTVEDVAVRGRGAAAVLAYTLVNRGNVALAPELSVRAEGVFGAVAAPAVRTPAEALPPGRRVELTEPWPAAPDLDRVRVTITATAPGGARGSATASAWLVPRAAAALTGLGLLVLGAAAAVALRRVRARRGLPEPVDHDAPAPGPAAAGPAPAPEHELTGAPR
ncbi:hypothetical protein ACFYUL_06315 [Streptomyces sp. NPDC004311]|uniref:COG1470 family protein n=1 Tax=Streptomyces sp. NPDC004311 TaxID=3364698 RepID=UPI003693AB45